jgi:hypothetical protein
MKGPERRIHFSAFKVQTAIRHPNFLARHIPSHCKRLPHLNCREFLVNGAESLSKLRMAFSSDWPRQRALKDIRPDERWQAWPELDEDHIAGMVATLKAKKRLNGNRRVVFWGDQEIWPADGFYSWHAHERAGLKKMECDVRNGQRSEAEEYAMQWANRGLGKKPDERTTERQVRWHLARRNSSTFLITPSPRGRTATFGPSRFIAKR